MLALATIIAPVFRGFEQALFKCIQNSLDVRSDRRSHQEADGDEAESGDLLRGESG